MLAPGMTDVTRRVTVLVALFALTAMAAPPVHAAPIVPKASVEALFHEFGLFGRWAVDCGAPASAANPHVEDEAPGAGVVVEMHDLGPGNIKNRYSVLSAERLGADRIGLRVIFLPGTDFEERQRLEVVVRGDTRRTMFNQPDGEPPRVKDGVALGMGLKTPLLRRCE